MVHPHVLIGAHILGLCECYSISSRLFNFYCFLAFVQGMVVMMHVLILWGVPIGSALWWYFESDQPAALIWTIGSLVWLTIWGLALRQETEMHLD